MTGTLLALSLALAYNGMAALCLAMDRHYAQLRGRGTAPSTALRRWLRVAGALCLLLSGTACVADSGWAIGSVLWAGELTAGALFVTVLWTYSARTALVLGTASLMAGLLAQQGSGYTYSRIFASSLSSVVG